MMPLVQTVIGAKVKGAPAWLSAPAAASYARMLAAGCPTGGITDAGRTYAEQQEMYAAYLAGKLEATAAYPGTSKHETGTALDLAGTAREWVRTYGAAYGWVADLVPREPWHLEYKAKLDTAPAPTTEDDDMTPEQDNLLRHAIAMLGEVPERTATAVHATPVHRVEGQPSTALDDAVLGTTAAVESRALLAALTATVATLATAQGADPAVITAAAQAGARAALADLTLTAHLT